MSTSLQKLTKNIRKRVAVHEFADSTVVPSDPPPTKVKRPRLDFTTNPTADIEPYSLTNHPVEVPINPSHNSSPDKEILKRVHFKKPQGASEALKGFIAIFAQLLYFILAPESPPTIAQPCECGIRGALKVCHCNDCYRFRPCCEECFVKQHRYTPFHWAEVWNGTFLERKDISKLGHVLKLGHSLDCKASGTVLDFTIIDVTGVHRTRVSFCSCIGEKHDRVRDLLSNQIFPATVVAPETGFTFNFLRDWHLQSLTSKKSPYDYLLAARRKTNNAFVDEVPNPYAQFLRVQRLWRVLTILKRSGQVHCIDQLFPFRRPGNTVVTCLACPEPGFNVPDEQWETVDEDLQFLNTLMIMKDGHFGLQRFAKVDDPDDISLLNGSGLFPKDDEYDKYVREIVAYSDEKSTCSSFNAVVMQNKMKFKGSVITGVLAVECMRHMLFISMVDLQKGERYANADFALAHALRRFTANRSLEKAKFFRRILETYDVACQYYIHLKSRFSDNFPDLSSVIDLINMLVPKKHLDGHKDDCKYRFSLNYAKGSGRGHGEGIEVSWSESKQAGGSTRQMNHGHRHDTLNDLHNDWNWMKTQGLAQSLADHLKTAIVSREAEVKHFLGLSVLRGESNVRKWEQEPTDPWLEDGEWQSVYRFRKAKLPGKAAVLQSLEASEKAEARRKDTANKDHFSQPHLFSRLLHKGLKLHDKQRDLRESAKKLSPEDLKDRRNGLLTELASFRMTQLRILPQLEDIIENSDIQLDPENEVLFLPSDFDLQQRQALGIDNLAQLEYQLREGEANDAVSGICNSILHLMVSRDAKNTHARGVQMTTRAESYLNGIRDKKHTYAARYRESRRRLLALASSNTTNTNTAEDFPELKDEDMYAKNAASARNIGDGKRVDSWLWTYGNLRGLSDEEKADFMLECEKVQWFRAQADMERWVEEVELLEEEFRRLIRGCEKMTEVWTSLSQTLSSTYRYPPLGVEHVPMSPNIFTSSTHGSRAYALQKAEMYRKMAMKARAQFTTAGGGWPATDETLSEYVWRRRPTLTVDWDAVRQSDK